MSRLIALPEIRKAVVAKVRAHPPFAAGFDSGKYGVLQGDKIYDALAAAPQDANKAPLIAAMPYLVLKSPNDQRDSLTRVFGQAGSTNRLLIDVWSPHHASQTEALWIYGQLVSLFDEAFLVMLGHRVVTGTVELLFCEPDEDGRSMHAVVSYSLSTRNVP